MILEDVLLSRFTTIGLGGKAKYFTEAGSKEEIISALKFAEKNNLRVQVISGGSNIIFADNGFDGLVIKVDLRGMEFKEDADTAILKVNAGDVWDSIVLFCINKGLTGIECLSGIPGSAGATPVQNVGAYGQEVKDTILSLKAIDRNTLKEIDFNNDECEFGYRQSRFKNTDKDSYIITEIIFCFEKRKEPEILYPELSRLIDSKMISKDDSSIIEKLTIIRNSVLELRKGKSMLIDIKDPDSRSCGSFFMNPVLNKEEMERFNSVAGDLDRKVPVFRSGDKYKIPAAWLVEKSGYYKGYIKGGVGISSNHSLALININGTTDELLELADEIKVKVFEKFGIELKKEPVIV